MNLKRLRRIKIRWWYSLGVIPLWLFWVGALGYSEGRVCAEHPADYGISVGSSYSYGDTGCFSRFPSWRAPFRGLADFSPKSGLLYFWLFGTIGAVLVAAVILYLAHRQRVARRA